MSKVKTLIFVGALAMSFIASAANTNTQKPKTMVMSFEIDKYKRDGKEWDNIPLASNPPPDVYGKVTLPNDRTEDIPLHEDSYQLKIVIQDVELKVGDLVHVELFDRDRGRQDDVIATGDILYTGERETKENLGKATVKVTFLE